MSGRVGSLMLGGMHAHIVLLEPLLSLLVGQTRHEELPSKALYVPSAHSAMKERDSNDNYYYNNILQQQEVRITTRGENNNKR